MKKGTMLTMRKHLLSAAFVLAVLMVLSLAFAIPSGAITEEAQSRYFDALWEDEYDFDEEARKPEPIAVLASAVFSDILPAANVNPLENDLFAPGSTPLAEGFTENGAFTPSPRSSVALYSPTSLRWSGRSSCERSSFTPRSASIAARRSVALTLP